MPNAGKSTFLAASSAAKPKIANYPFTTLHPNLGVVKIENYDFILADIPGLIEGASEGHGLGDRFLGHVERTRVLLHVIDINQPDPLADYYTIRGELEAYGAGLDEKPEIIALNKSDTLLEEESAAVVALFEEELGVTPYLISGVSGEGVRPVLFKLVEIIREAKAQEYESLTPPQEFKTTDH